MMFASLMHRIDYSSNVSNSNDDTLNMITKIDFYEQLNDVEYIEDIMFEFISEHK